MKGFWVYLLQCADRTYYTGHTDDMERRLYEHEQELFPCYTCGRLPVRLVYCCPFDSREAAIAMERRIKGWSRKKKQALMSDDWEALKRYSKSGATRYHTDQATDTLRQAQGERDEKLPAYSQGASFAVMTKGETTLIWSK